MRVVPHFLPHQAALFAALVQLLLFWTMPVHAAAPGPIVERLLQHYVVETSGAYRLTVYEVQVVPAAGPRQGGVTYTIDYNAVREQVQDVAIYAQKPDGRRMPLVAAQVRDRQQAPPAFADMRLKTFALAGVWAGDRLVVRYTIRGSRALFDGHFEDLVAIPPGRVRDLQVIYDMPPGLPLYADAAGFAPVAGADPPGRRRYQWRRVDAGGAAVRSETGAVSCIDYGRRLAVSTFPDYPAFAAALRRGLAGKAQPTPEIAALAQQVAGSLPDAGARALALAGWVRRNVRHVGDYPGADPVAPRTAASVLASRYGDCKDEAVLLQALLEAAGIRSTTALVNDGAAYRMPDVPTLGVFNHMLTYVPDLGLYLDASAAAPDDADAGYLPAPLLGKPVLLVESGTFAMTPLLQPRRTAAASTIAVERDARFAARAPVALATTSAAGNPVGDALAGMTREKDRRLDYVCPAIDAQDDTAWRMPAGVRVLTLPAPVSVVNGGIFYRAEYRRQTTAQGEAVAVTRRLTFRHGRPTCTPADYRAMRPALARIARDLRSRVVVADR